MGPVPHVTKTTSNIVVFLGPYSKNMQNMMVVAVGVPAYKAKMKFIHV
jgi:hypothetical protein